MGSVLERPRRPGVDAEDLVDLAGLEVGILQFVSRYLRVEKNIVILLTEARENSSGSFA